MAELREAISSRVIAPLDLVMLTRERIEEAVDDAVSRGRVTADDAQDLVPACSTAAASRPTTCSATSSS